AGGPSAGSGVEFRHDPDRVAIRLQPTVPESQGGDGVAGHGDDDAPGAAEAGQPVTTLRYHFSGIAGAGMGPLACLMRARGHEVQGSDRAFDLGKKQEIAAPLRRLGIELARHDGTAVTSAIDRFVYSAAVEADTPELRAARTLGIDCLPRPQLLAEVVNTASPGVAIAGTSGKSTIVGMLGWLLREGRGRATVLGGADGGGGGAGGCFVAGRADGPAVAEACESDGTLVGYHPAIGIIHNVSRDHDELAALRPQFTAFARN